MGLVDRGAWPLKLRPLFLPVNALAGDPLSRRVRKAERSPASFSPRPQSQQLWALRFCY